MKHIIIVTGVISILLLGFVYIQHNSGIYWWVFGTGDAPKGLIK